MTIFGIALRSETMRSVAASVAVSATVLAAACAGGAPPPQNSSNANTANTANVNVMTVCPPSHSSTLSDLIFKHDKGAEIQIDFSDDAQDYTIDLINATTQLPIGGTYAYSDKPIVVTLAETVTMQGVKVRINKAGSHSFRFAKRASKLGARNVVAITVVDECKVCLDRSLSFPTPVGIRFVQNQ
jgi:hypothetical protein